MLVTESASAQTKTSDCGALDSLIFLFCLNLRFLSLPGRDCITTRHLADTTASLDTVKDSLCYRFANAAIDVNLKI